MTAFNREKYIAVVIESVMGSFYQKQKLINENNYAYFY